MFDLTWHYIERKYVRFKDREGKVSIVTIPMPSSIASYHIAGKLPEKFVGYMVNAPEIASSMGWKV